MKHTNSILEYFEHFCQMASKSILIISSCTVSKFTRFLRHSVLYCRYFTVVCLWRSAVVLTVGVRVESFTVVFLGGHFLFTCADTCCRMHRLATKDTRKSSFSSSTFTCVCVSNSNVICVLSIANFASYNVYGSKFASCTVSSCFEQVVCCALDSHTISDSIIPWKRIGSRKTCRLTITKFPRMFQVINVLLYDCV